MGVIIRNADTKQCCLLNENPLYYSAGNSTLYHKLEIPTLCAAGPGWQEPECSFCKFGFETASGCTTCILNGVWMGTVVEDGVEKTMKIHMTFGGENCSTVADGVSKFSLF